MGGTLPYVQVPAIMGCGAEHSPAGFVRCIQSDCLGTGIRPPGAVLSVASDAYAAHRHFGDGKGRLETALPLGAVQFPLWRAPVIVAGPQRQRLQMLCGR
jgi:hypothetical protein